MREWITAFCSGDARCRFLIGGTTAALVNWALRFPFNWVMPYGAAVVAAGAVGIVFGFVLYRAWVFPRSRRPLVAQMRDFVIINLLSLAVVTAAAVLARDALVALGMQHEVAAALGHAIGIAIGAVANYIGHNNITFRHRS